MEWYACSRKKDPKQTNATQAVFQTPLHPIYPLLFLLIASTIVKKPWGGVITSLGVGGGVITSLGVGGGGGGSSHH